MFYIQLYAFSKNKNSTKQPTGTGQQLACLIKSGSSIIDPIVTVKENPSAYNYAYIPTFSRYYFIRDISYVLGEWELTLSADPLASFKSAIGSTSAYVLRSASSKNGYIKDNMYALTGSHTSNVQTWSPYPISDSGYYYLTAVSKSASQYALRMNQANFDTMIHALMGYGDDASLWQTVEQSIKNQTLNPIQYITSVFWSPITFPSNSGGVSLVIGDYDTGAAYSYITDKFITASHTFTIAAHPQASARGVYCNMSPYSEHTISAGGFGQFTVPSDLLTKTTNTVEISICIDTRNGTGTMVAKCNGVRFARLSGSVGVQVPISQASRDVLGGAVALASGATSLALGNVAGGIGALMGGIQSLAGQTVSTTGTLGSLANLYDDIRLTSVWYDIAGADNTNNGSPLCSYVAISTLSGYLQCEKGTFKSTTATETEIDAVNGYMVSGFYYE